MNRMFAAMLGAGLVLGVAPAFAGEWRLDSRRCSDLREDRRDARESRYDEAYDYGRQDRSEDRYDRRESARDRAVTVCPRSAFYFVERGNGQRDDDRGQHRRPPLHLEYDRRLRMQYTDVVGRRVYVRGWSQLRPH